MVGPMRFFRLKNLIGNICILKHRYDIFVAVLLPSDEHWLEQFFEAFLLGFAALFEIAE